MHEPRERLSIDVPEADMGAIPQLMASRKAQMTQMINHGHGRVRMEYVVPARGLIGFHNEFLIETRGTGIANHVFEGYEPWHGELRTRHTGSLVADRSGQTTGYALQSLQDRGQLFVAPGTQVYEGMIVGENPRSQDMDVNPTRPKKQTNMRAAAADATEHLATHRTLTLEEALEFIMADECLEVTPRTVRLRKVTLGQLQRGREQGQRKHAKAG